MNNYKVYCHKNKINQKLYIGITYQDCKKRWHSDGSGYKQQPKFYNAIQKYGWDNFEHIVLFENLSCELAKEIEKFLIKKYNTQNNGYNTTGGGEGLLNFKHSKDTIQKMKQSALGKDPTRTRPVRCLETGHVFLTVKEAAIWAKCSTTIIIKACKKEKPSAKGYHWCYNDEYNSSLIIPLLPVRSRKVICLTNNKIFLNATEAAKWCNLSNGGKIHEVCQGKRVHAGKDPISKERLSWRYLNE